MRKDLLISSNKMEILSHPFPSCPNVTSQALWLRQASKKSSKQPG